MNQKMKKGTDVLEVIDASGEYPVLLKYNDKDVQTLIKALERLIGSPALDDYSEGDAEAPVVTLKRYRLKEDIELVEE